MTYEGASRRGGGYDSPWRTAGCPPWPCLFRCARDFTSAELRREARRSRDANQARRLLALAAIYDGGSRSDAARIGGVGLQTVRDWVLRFNAEGPEG